MEITQFINMTNPINMTMNMTNTMNITMTNPIDDPVHSCGNEHEEHVGVHLASWRWEEIGGFVAMTWFMVFSGIAKIGFHHLHFLSSRIPESCLLVIIGVACGALLKTELPEYTSEFFFHYLLPPIILEAAYSLYDKVFLDNLITILIFAVIGTAFNFILIGSLLVGTYSLGLMGEIGEVEVMGSHNCTLEMDPNYSLQPVEVFLFSSLISAVDPVAVLAIFQEVGVNADLYYLVFGESLLNDGVAVVFYNMMNAFAGMEANNIPITAGDLALSICSFFTVALGGLLVGVIYGFITAAVTKTTKQVQVVEPLAVLGLAYSAYMTAELFHWSGIISMIGCGLTQAHYSFRNISEKSHTTVKYFVAMLSSTMDCIIFLYLGMALVTKEHNSNWHTGFVTWSVVYCLIVRFIGVYSFTYFINKKRMKPINLQSQFIMAYGGLRGAVGFSLVINIDKMIVPAAPIFVTTTLIIVMCTIGIQGATIKPLVNLLKIDKKKDEQKTLNEELNDNVLDHIMAGIEVISGRQGQAYILSLVEYYDETYLSKWFCRPNVDSEMTRLYEKLCLTDHLVNLYGPVAIQESMDHVDNGPFLTEAPMDTRARQMSVITSLMPKTHIDSQSHVGKMDARGGAGEVREDDRQTLKNALQDNPFNKYHYNYNRNLVREEDQSLGSHLQRRRSNTRKLSELVLQRHPSVTSMTSHITFKEQTESPLVEQLLHLPVPSRGGVHVAGVSAILHNQARRVSTAGSNISSRGPMSNISSITSRGTRLPGAPGQYHKIK